MFFSRKYVGNFCTFPSIVLWTLNCYKKYIKKKRQLENTPLSDIHFLQPIAGNLAMWPYIASYIRSQEM